MYFSLGTFTRGYMNRTLFEGLLIAVVAVCFMGLGLNGATSKERRMYFALAIIFAITGKAIIRLRAEEYKSQQNKAQFQKTSLNNPRS